MNQAIELGNQTVTFLKQPENQRRLEKNLLIERVRGTKEGLESVSLDIKERVAVLERMNGLVSTSGIAPIGWSQLSFAGADAVATPNAIGYNERDQAFCKHDVTRYWKIRTISG